MPVIIRAGTNFPRSALDEPVDVNVAMFLTEVPQAAWHCASEAFHFIGCKPRNFHPTANKFHWLEMSVAQRLEKILCHNFAPI